MAQLSRSTMILDIGYWIKIMMMIMLNLSCCTAALMPTTNKEKAQLVMKSKKYDSTATTTICFVMVNQGWKCSISFLVCLCEFY